MKRLFSILCAMILFAGLTTGQASAISYCKDMEPLGDKSWDDEIHIDVGTTLEVDLWINDIPPVISGGLFLIMDSTLGTVTDIVVADGNEQPGQWDAGSTTELPNPIGVGSYYLTIGQFAGAGAVPDGDGDIFIGTATVECFSPGNLLITVSVVPTPGYDTWVDTGGTVYDSQIAPNTITIHQYSPPCECTITGPTLVEADPFNEVTIPYTVAPGVNCTNPPNYVWSDDCSQASVGQTGLLTIPPAIGYEDCTITVVDSSNIDDTGQPVECILPIEIYGYYRRLEIARGRECPGEEIDDPAYNRPGRRGLAATCDDIIDFTVCGDFQPWAPECMIWEIDPPEPWLGINQIDDCCWRLSIGEACDMLEKVQEYEITVEDTCNFASDSVIIQIGKVIVGLQDATVDPEAGSVELAINLTNPEHHVRAIQMDIEECTGGEDNLECTECVIDPNRALEFTCSVNEQPDGSCRMVMYSTNPAALITQADSPGSTIATVILDAVDPQRGDCVCLTPVDIELSDQFNEDLCACQDPGEVCFKNCGDIYPQDCIGGPCGGDLSCGDGVVDLFDILEAVDIILGLQDPTCCQIDNGDVPNGMPPYCGEPAGTPNCQNTSDLDGLGACDPYDIASYIDRVSIFDVLVIIDKALGKSNCCDYCLFGQLF